MKCPITWLMYDYMPVNHMISSKLLYVYHQLVTNKKRNHDYVDECMFSVWKGSYLPWDKQRLSIILQYTELTFYVM